MDIKTNINRVNRLIGREEKNKEILAKIASTAKKKPNRERANKLIGRESLNVEILKEVLEDLEEPEPPQLCINDGILCYWDGGKKPIYPIGASPRQLLWSPLGFANPMEKPYEWFIEQFKSTDVTLVRCNAVENYDFEHNFCKEMESAEVVVQLSMFDDQIEEPHFGDPAIHFDILQDLNNIIIESVSEFMDDWSTYDKALKISADAQTKGYIVSAGGWGNSHHGEAMARKFLTEFKGKIFVIHRPYGPGIPKSVFLDYLGDVLDAGFIPFWNEILVQPFISGLEVDEVVPYSRAFLDNGGVAVNEYMKCEDFIGSMSELSREYNGMK